MFPAHWYDLPRRAACSFAVALIGNACRRWNTRIGIKAIDVLIASDFSIAAIICLQYLVPAEYVPTEASLLLAMYAAVRTIPLVLFALGATYKQALPALLILGALAGAVQLLGPGIVCLSMILKNTLGRSLSPFSNSS
jgi:hypothetical protein